MTMENDPRLHLLLPIDEIEEGAKEQINECLEREDLIVLAIMPDVHQGYSLPVGGVALLKGTISPAYVGVDIGCGTIHVDTGFPIEHLFPKEGDKIRTFNNITADIPTGYKMNATKSYINSLPDGLDPIVTKKIQDKAGYQLGTLGGGNHVIEIGMNLAGSIGVTVHSGSRNPGHTIAQYFIREVGDFISEEDDAAILYLACYKWAADYALQNRQIMLQKTLQAMGIKPDAVKSMCDRAINKNHNTIDLYDGSLEDDNISLFLHRKGAIPAEKDSIGIILGNMKDGVAVVRCVGNQKYLESASHGCGRVMGRKAFERSDTEANHLTKLAGNMEGIIARIDKDIIDESPEAYKDMEIVLDRQMNIVIDGAVIYTPLINVKG